VVRLLWLVSALLTLAAGAAWVLNVQEIMQYDNLIRRAVLPILTVAQAVVLYLCRGQLLTGERRPTEPGSFILLVGSFSLLIGMTYRLKELGQ